ncbi:hypothetical protein E2C01_084228 [Portunus trituberculatus]|uniref:Uncharacterized protein n=1 Tax=Portunus trituberculatus TaxID=210409 RepID=A0A5B7IXQ7_PORTR|nr:hypothetical protein [Portunus trituberculatus]
MARRRNARYRRPRYHCHMHHASLLSLKGPQGNIASSVTINLSLPTTFPKPHKQLLIKPPQEMKRQDEHALYSNTG